MKLNRIIFSNPFSEVMMSTLMLIIQFCGLMWSNWSGLYVIYLCWIDLLFLTVYTVLRERQLHSFKSWSEFKNRRPYLFEENQHLFYFIRIISLVFYLLLIGTSAIPYEKGFVLNEEHLMTYKEYEIHSMQDFFMGLWVGDPLFIASVLFIISYYLKKLATTPDTSEAGMVEFSFHFSSNDPYYAYPLLAIMTFIIPAMFMYSFYKDDGELKSYLFTYAMWLLFFRFLADLLMVYRLRKEMKKSLD